MQPCLNVESGAGAAENEEDTWSGFGASLRRPEGRSYLQPMWSSTLLQACSAELGGGQHKDWRIGSAGTLSGSTPKQGALDNSGHYHQLQIEHKIARTSNCWLKHLQHKRYQTIKIMTPVTTLKVHWPQYIIDSIDQPESFNTKVSYLLLASSAVHHHNGPPIFLPNLAVA